MIARKYPGIDIPELTNSQIKDIFLDLQTQLNNAMLGALTHGFYTGVVAVTLWAVASRNNRGHNSQRTPHFLVFIILLLYLLATFNFYYGWDVEISKISITDGKNFWTAYNYQLGTPITLAGGIGMHVQELAIAMRGIAPTVLVGRVAAGHARPDDSWSGSTTRSSLRFRSHSNSQTDSRMSAGSGWNTSSHIGLDLEEGLEGNTPG